jgi:hypothetical protein
METGTKVCAVDRIVPRRLWIIDVLAFGAVQFHMGVSRLIMLTHWK